MKFLSSQSPAWSYSISIRLALLAAACASCSGDIPGPAPIPPAPAVSDVRFKAVDNTLSLVPTKTTVLPGNTLITENNQVGTPLEVTPCGQQGGGDPNCAWPYETYQFPGGIAGTNTVYNALGQLTNLEADLQTMQNGTFNPLPTQPQVNPNSVITSLVVDGPNNVYGTSGIQRGDMQDFQLTWGAVPLGTLQAVATQTGVQGRVITAVSFHGTNVVYLSYAWTKDVATRYESAVVSTSFDNLVATATNLAAQGYIITALGGDPARSYVLVGTRTSGQTTPRPLAVATDSIVSPDHTSPVTVLVSSGYAVVGGIFDSHTGDSHAFNVYIGEK
jgi:hypothetical protein